MSEYMSKRSYGELDNSANALNDAALSLDIVRERFSTLYPDTFATEAKVSVMEDAIRYFEEDAAKAIAAIRTLIERDK